MRPHGIVHDKDGRLDVHNVVFFWVEKEPIVKERQLGITGRDVGRASGEEPSDNGPSWNNVGAEELICRVYDTDDEPYEIAAQRLRFRGRQVLPLKPILVSLVVAESHLTR